MWTEQKQLFVDASAKAFIEVMPLSLMTAKIRAPELLGAIEAKNENGLTTIIAAAAQHVNHVAAGGDEAFVRSFATITTKSFLDGGGEGFYVFDFDVRRSDGALYPFAIPSRRFI